MTEDIAKELQDLKQQLALLREEHARTRNGWLYWLRSTGIILMVYGAAFLLGVAISQQPSSAIAITFAVMAILMLALGLWLLVSSLRPVAERMMSFASRG